MKNYILLMAIISITGCSTQPIPTNQASVVSADRVWDKNITKNKDNAGTLIVKRDSGFIGSACFTSIYIDGNPIADLDTREKVTIYPKIGRHVLSATPRGWCAGGTVEVEANVELNKPLIYRLGYGANGDFRFSPTAF
ncbi:hypothetical protein M8T17_19970 [Enterobacter hormaechei]|nr:hypothetical protein [Enterobacter hormaechei]